MTTTTRCFQRRQGASGVHEVAQINSEQLNKLLQPHMDQDIPQKLVDMEKDKPLRMHNSFMRLEGFDSVKDTPNSWLYATEKFESYNGILRFASIHSNRQSPSQDIAITFSNHHAFCQLLSGGFFWDSKQEKYVQCSYQVINLFSQHPLIQQTLGYNRSVSTQNINYPLVKRAKVPEIDQLVIPQHLKNGYSEHEIKQISELHLNKKQVIKKNYLILFNNTQPPSSQLIGRVNAIWMNETDPKNISQSICSHIRQQREVCCEPRFTGIAGVT
ncbi:hypothetical protein H4Q26_014726 [Puccinia striiformis f. sp. tritici PST-130]|nr:hypothetical protein H4Q26_014726 [Puccinia striiformis f. sp. tritici PST-130]